MVWQRTFGHADSCETVQACESNRGTTMSDTPVQREYAEHLLEEVKSGRMTRRQLLVRASVIGLSATTMGRLLAACGGSSTPAASASSSAAPKAGGTLKMTMPSPTVALDPTTMYDTGSIAMTQQVAEYLIWVNNDLSLRPVLAESWSPDASAKVWTFKLRQGVKFQDGKPFTADDVVATMNILLNPKTVSAALSAFQGILSQGGVVKVDDHTVAFHLDSPFADFPYFVASTNYDCLILPSTFKPGTWEKTPVGTGPFVLKSYTPKQSATLVKNPNYWNTGKPYLDGVAVQFIDTTQTEALALQNGSSDMMLSTPYEGAQVLFSDANLKVLTTPSTMMRSLAMRVDKAPFTDKRVRQALAYTLDRQAIITNLFANKASLGNDNVFAPLYPLAPKDVPQRTQDIAKAKSLLAAAGMPNGVTMNLNVEGFEEVPHYATLLQGMAKPAGINLKLNQVTVTYWYGSGTNQPWLQAPMGITDWTFRGVPSQYFLPMYTSKGVWNSAQFKNPQFDTLAGQYDSTIDEASRRTYAKQMVELMVDETPYIIGYWISVNRAMKKNVQGVTADPAEFLDLTAAFLA
jgi:peptide/nickel transport system substrate-binding protein